MTDIEAIKWHLERYRSILTQQADRLVNALEELQRLTLMLFKINQAASDAEIEDWLSEAGFAVDEDDFFQSIPLLQAHRNNRAPDDAISISWGKHLKHDNTARRNLYALRSIGPYLKHIHKRLNKSGWIYYQDASNTALQFPYIDQKTAISWDFDWHSYHTYQSVNPQNNPQRLIRWTPPTIDYAGDGLIISISIPVWQAEQFIGIWSIDLPIKSIYQDFIQNKPIPGLSQFIANSSGELILHETLSAAVDKPKGQICLHSMAELGGQWIGLNLDQILSQESGVLSITDESGSEMLICHSHVPSLDWTLFCGMPKAAMDEAASQRLKLALQCVGNGNFKQRLSSDSANMSLNTLTETFNQMSLHLERSEEQRRVVESQLRQSQKMEAVGRLAGGVSHDFNNMLSVILGYSEMALDRLNEDNELYHDLHQIREAAQRSAEITRQLLAFARQQTIAPKVLNLNQTVSQMLKFLQRMIGENLELIWRPHEETWQIMIDPVQLDQILANLCINARDAITDIGQIVIETGNVTFDNSYCSAHLGFKPGEYATLTVSDTGCGMDKETLRNIFEPFFTTKENSGGTGLGMATVYGIVKQNNGFINVYSEPGQGTSTRIYLPRHLGQAEKQRENQPTKPHTGHETVLLVEDEVPIARMVHKMLQGLGYTVLSANSPHQAIELADSYQNPIDLLITDVVMPQMNGREMAQKLKNLHPQLNILFMSGYTANIIEKRGILESDTHFIQKPFSFHALSTKVREALGEATPK